MRKNRTKDCRNCGAENEFISHSKSYKCDSCGSLMDWSYDVECSNCGMVNSASKEDLEKRHCAKCLKPLRWTTSPETYAANHVPVKSRIVAAILSALLLAVAGYGLVMQHLVLPYGRRMRQSYYEFSGFEVTVPFFALCLAGLGFLLIIVDHYDKRNNEYKYQKAINYSIGIGWALYFVSIFIGHKVP